jgi:hypothetical protein
VAVDRWVADTGFGAPTGGGDRRGKSMFWIIMYETRESVTGKAQLGELMKTFGERGEMAGTVAHYAYPGGGGVVIVENDDPLAVYETALAYSEWLDFDIKAAVKVDDVVPKIVDYLGA